MAAKSSITFDVVFKPPKAGVYSAWLNWTSNGIRVGSISLTGTGVTPTASSSTTTSSSAHFTAIPSSVAFGNLAVGLSNSQTVKIMNDSSSLITLGLSISQDEFSLAYLPSNLTMAANASVTFNVVFKPPKVGTYSAWLNWTSNGARAGSIALSGAGVSATQVSAASVSLQWTAVSNASGYCVYRAFTSGGPYARLNSSLVTTAAYVDSTATRGQTYYYVVTSVSPGNIQSSYSNQAEVSVPSSP